MADYNFIQKIDENFDYASITFGELLKMIRKDKGYSKDNFANKLDIPVSHLSELENSISFPTKDFLLKISGIIGVKYENLLTSAGYDCSNSDLFYCDAKGNAIDVIKILDKIYYRSPNILSELYERIFGK